MELYSFLSQIGLDEKEQHIFLALHRNGALPVSTLAKKSGVERTGCYYILNQLEKEGLIGRTERSGVKVYFTKGDDVIEDYIAKKSEYFHKLKEDYQDIAPTLHALRLHESNTPSIEIYEGNKGIRQSFRDMKRILEQEELLEIRLIATDTFNEELGGSILKEVSGNFIATLQKKNIRLKSLIAKGNIVKEHFINNSILEDISNLPTSNQASNIYLIGNHIFILSFHDTPVGIQIRHGVIAKLMHFVFDTLENNVGN